LNLLKVPARHPLAGARIALRMPGRLHRGIMVAHGFMLANLIRAQLATALIERMVAGGRPIDWVQRAELAHVGVRATHIET
jgi:hypothetical protein